jgi:hypothetical protein
LVTVKFEIGALFQASGPFFECKSIEEVIRDTFGKCHSKPIDA